MTDTPVTTRPTPLAERTLAGLALGFCLNVIIFAGFLAWKNWPDAVARDIIHFLGATLIILALGNLLIVIGMMSPWIGTVRVSGMGVNLDVNGSQDNG